MAFIYNIDNVAGADVLAGTSCAFGVFDGVHVGHRFIIEQMIADARQSDAESLVLTFDRDPDELFHADTLKKLMSNEERIIALASFDVDGVVTIPFTNELSAVPPYEFLNEYFGENIPSSLHVGCDFRFGARASGTVNDLRIWGDDKGMCVNAHDLYCKDDAPVTSTRIRTLLAQGCIEEANSLLGHRYNVTAVIEPGRGEGSQMGFATANANIPTCLCALADGVYAAYAAIDNTCYKAAVSVGVSPTFADVASANMEIHVLDFSGDLYGKSVTVSFVRWLRPMRAFDSTEDLIETVKDNIEWVRTHL